MSCGRAAKMTAKDRRRRNERRTRRRHRQQRDREAEARDRERWESERLLADARREAPPRPASLRRRWLGNGDIFAACLALAVTAGEGEQ